jgi:hypothetical protein
MQKKLKFISFLNIKTSFKVKASFLVFLSSCVYIFIALINDWSSSSPPDIYSFTPFIYNITVRGDQIELLVPCNQGNWIDCNLETDQQPAENSIFSISYKIAFFCCV